MLTIGRCIGADSSESTCQTLNSDLDSSSDDYDDTACTGKAHLPRPCGLIPRSDSVETCFPDIGGGRYLLPDVADHSSQRRSSMPGHSSTAGHEVSLGETLDPFPEISKNSLTPVSARLYWPELGQVVASDQTELSGQNTESDDSTEGGTTCDHQLQKPLPEKVHIQFHNDDRSSRSIEISMKTTVSDVCDTLVTLNHLKHDINWTIVEHLAKFNLERSVEDHELILPIYRAWGSNRSDKRFYFRKDFTKYELFRNPSQYFPEQMVDVKFPTDESLGFLTRHERYKNILLRNLLANQTMPDIQGYLQIREGKWSWKKYYCILRNSGLYFSSKGSLKDPRFFVLISHLGEVDIYLVRNAKKAVNAPNQFCFCLKPPSNVTERKQLKVFCAEDEQSRLCWMTGMRFIKFGSQLRENFRAKVKVDTRLQSIENRNSKLQDELYVKNRVAMDFSGEQGHVVDDPNEALCVAIEEGHNWRVKAHRQYGGPPSQSARPQDDQPATSRPAVMEMHFTQPWFYGNLNRQEATRLIEQQGLINGVFVVRRSQSMAGVYVLSFAHNHKVKHCPIYKVEDKDQFYYTLDNSATKFMDLIQLVDFYQLNAGALPTELTYHITKIL